jgi:uncharacterized membrane protein
MPDDAPTPTTVPKRPPLWVIVGLLCCVATFTALDYWRGEWDILTVTFTVMMSLFLAILAWFRWWH